MQEVKNHNIFAKITSLFACTDNFELKFYYLVPTHFLNAAVAKMKKYWKI